MSAIVTLKKGEGRLLKSGGAWIFDNEIDSIMGNFENGDIVMVNDFDGYHLGKGFINTYSKITVRCSPGMPAQRLMRHFSLNVFRMPGITERKRWTPVAAGSYSEKQIFSPA